MQRQARQYVITPHKYSVPVDISLLKFHLKAVLVAFLAGWAAWLNSYLPLTAYTSSGWRAAHGVLAVSSMSERTKLRRAQRKQEVLQLRRGCSVAQPSLATDGGDSNISVSSVRADLAAMMVSLEERFGSSMASHSAMMGDRLDRLELLMIQCDAAHWSRSGQTFYWEVGEADRSWPPAAREPMPAPACTISLFDQLIANTNEHLDAAIDVPVLQACSVKLFDLLPLPGLAIEYIDSTARVEQIVEEASEAVVLGTYARDLSTRIYAGDALVDAAGGSFGPAMVAPFRCFPVDSWSTSI